MLALLRFLLLFLFVLFHFRYLQLRTFYEDKFQEETLAVIHQQTTVLKEIELSSDRLVTIGSDFSL
jgi:hypothetical protein